MRTAKTWALLVMFTVLPLWLLADGTVSPPNPVGERLYYEFLRAHFFSQLLPLVLLGSALLLICLALLSQHRARKLAERGAGLYEI